MNPTLAAGTGLSVLGFVGYATGIAWSYPGRSFSLAALMVGVTLLAIGRSLDGEVAA
jgi:preprotein translocase subunit Sss1